MEMLKLKLNGEFSQTFHFDFSINGDGKRVASIPLILSRSDSITNVYGKQVPFRERYASKDRGCCMPRVPFFHSFLTLHATLNIRIECACKSVENNVSPLKITGFIPWMIICTISCTRKSAIFHSGFCNFMVRATRISVTRVQTILP